MNDSDNTLANALPSDLITTNEAAKLAHAHLASVYRWCLGDSRRAPRLRSWRRAGRLFVSRAELLALFELRGRPAPKVDRGPQPLTRAQEIAEDAADEAILRRFGLGRDKLGPG